MIFEVKNLHKENARKFSWRFNLIFSSRFPKIRTHTQWNDLKVFHENYIRYLNFIPIKGKFCRWSEKFCDQTIRISEQRCFGTDINEILSVNPWPFWWHVTENSVKEDYSNDQIYYLRESVCQLTLVNPKWISNPNKIHQWTFYEMVYEHIFGKNRGKIWSSKNVNFLHKHFCIFYEDQSHQKRHKQPQLKFSDWYQWFENYRMF